jgi:hypothetical protein
MGRIIGLVLMVAGIYFVVTTYLGEGGTPDEPQASTARRAGTAVEKAYSEGAARREALLPE